MMYDKRSLERLVMQMYHDTIRVESKYHVWKQIINSSKERYDLMNRIAPAYFNMTTSALFTDFVISLTKLFDSDSKVVGNLKKLIDIAEGVNSSVYEEQNNAGISIINKSTLEGYKKQLEEQKPILDNLFKWRDKVFAHYDKKYYLDRKRIHSDAQVRYEEIDILFELLHSILNNFSLALSGRALYPEAIDALDIERLFNVIEKHPKLLEEMKQLMVQEEEYYRVMLLAAGHEMSNDSNEGFEIEELIDIIHENPELKDEEE
ncbi:hypothetical protein [Paenibacillus popilliae]|uniref:HEPN AbiU2-like domain-containing protein n=1 Tax=Paenibacillus popilliae TaxID=78057 RepID=A0ABY3AH35_PAEPP|nr:hypothetical protein [Paenibacillus sp. SDF0028]TQR40172.1 hypothetical protein C7Y44_28210 [Paenibacillus sp. SDF0028]